MTTDDLRAFGANVDEGLARCMGNEAIYLRLVGTVVNDANFGRLEDALTAGDLDAAFQAAHALKGALGNLSLTPLYDPICEVTELLRARTDTDYSAFRATVNSAREQLQALV